nr:hypothetical protein [Sedimentibacter sp.]
MKMKIKVKTLIFAALVFTLTFVWGIPAATLGIANYLEKKNSDKAVLFFEKYADYPTSSNIEAKFLYADSLIEGFDKYSIFFNGWGGGEDTSPENMEKAKKILINIMKENPRNESEKGYYLDSYKMILDMAIAAGNVDMLNQWISFGQKCDDERLIYISDIYNGFLLHVNGDNEGAKKIIEKYDMTNVVDGKLDVLKGEIALFDGEYEEAKKMFEKVNDNWQARDEIIFGSTGYHYRNFWIDRTMKEFKGNNVIRGTVTYEGKPMPFVEIYVQEADGGFRSGGESYIGITNKNGEFQTLGLKDGVYNIGIGIEGYLLTDKVLQRSNYQYLELNGDDGEINFVFNNTLNVSLPKPGEKVSGEEFTVSWEAVGGADYYTVEPVVFSEPYEKSGSSFRSPVIDKNGETRFTGTSATFNISMLSNQLIGLTFEGEEMLLGPEAVLGIFMHGIEYPIVVNAYDDNNNLITSSLPLRAYYDQISSITIEGSITEGEDMILCKDYPKAIEFYENILKDTPDDKDALRYLTKIYGIGWKKGEKNIERAIALGQKYTDVSGDSKLLFEILKSMDINELKENMELVDSVLDIESENTDDNGYYFLSKYNIALENYESARDALNNIESYVSDNLFYLNMYFGDYMKAAANIQSKNFYISRLSSYKVTQALEALENSPPNAADKKAFDDFLLKLVTGIHHEEGKSIYDETIKRISNVNLNAILYEIYIERNWDTEF